MSNRMIRVRPVLLLLLTIAPFCCCLLLTVTASRHYLFLTVIILFLNSIHQLRDEPIFDGLGGNGTVAALAPFAAGREFESRL